MGWALWHKWVACRQYWGVVVLWVLVEPLEGEVEVSSDKGVMVDLPLCSVVRENAEKRDKSRRGGKKNGLGMVVLEGK